MFISLSKQNKENVGCFLVDTVFRQEHKKHRELLPHIGPLPIVIPLKLFLERIGFPADNISSRVAWTFRGRAKVHAKTRRDPTGVRELDECETRVYPLLMQNSFLRVSF